jgi:hypothetical protein
MFPENKKGMNSTTLMLWSQYYAHSKPNKDATEKDNYRSITFKNTATKILKK